MMKMKVRASFNNATPARSLPVWKTGLEVHNYGLFMEFCPCFRGDKLFAGMALSWVPLGQSGFGLAWNSVQIGRIHSGRVWLEAVFSA